MPSLLKSSFISLVLIFAVSASHAGISIQVGQGEWICSSEGIKDYPTLARGTSRMKAEFLAQKKCAEYEGSEFHCKVKTCVKDESDINARVNISFSINRSGTNVSINLNKGQPTHSCLSKAFTRSYMAEAPTELEAQVLARQTCVGDKNHGMHCDVKKCEALEVAASGSVNKDGIQFSGGMKDLKKLGKKLGF